MNKKRNRSFSLCNFFIKNRRGQHVLTEETLKIIIAVICLAFLAFLAYAIYNSFKAGSDLEKAKASLEHIQTEISNQAAQVEIFNPINWFFSSWPRRFLTEENVFPKLCSDKKWNHCLCFCNAESFGCGEGGVMGICIESDFSVNSNPGNSASNSIEIVNPPLILSIDYQNKTITQKQNE